ncbi:hypothetical protein Nepgr_004011 [Nepenthes gracilis]|uniref:Uncharacterized protein n=1 Tax=Nepenthes gracilis TaxID=150966 RepID=A0AAD3XEL2_NEPGR|nr:hypothetical protein Nepgr_004011 [Nepenthes gracilis]
MVRFETPICPLSVEAFPPLLATSEPTGFAPSRIQVGPLRSAEPASLWSKKSPSHPQANSDGASSSWSEVVQNNGATPNFALRFYPPQVVDGCHDIDMGSKRYTAALPLPEATSPCTVPLAHFGKIDASHSGVACSDSHVGVEVHGKHLSDTVGPSAPVLVDSSCPGL